MTKGAIRKRDIGTDLPDDPDDLEPSAADGSLLVLMKTPDTVVPTAVRKLKYGFNVLLRNNRTYHLQDKASDKIALSGIIFINKKTAKLVEQDSENPSADISARRPVMMFPRRSCRAIAPSSIWQATIRRQIISPTRGCVGISAIIPVKARPLHQRCTPRIAGQRDTPHCEAFTIAPEAVDAETPSLG